MKTNCNKRMCYQQIIQTTIHNVARIEQTLENLQAKVE